MVSYMAPGDTLYNFLMHWHRFHPCVPQMIPGSLSFTGQDRHPGEMVMGRAKWCKWLLCSILAWCWARLLCRAHSWAMFPSALFKHALIDLQGLCSLLALAQLGKLVLLLLRVLGWPQPIILNPLSVIIGFRNISPPQWRLRFLSASDGYTTFTQYALCRPRNV